MKILLANKYFYLKGGAEASFFETAKLLKNKGHKVIFFSMKHKRNFSSECEKYFVSNVDYEKDGFKNMITSSVNILYSFEAKRKIERLIEKEKPDVAHLHNIYHQISPSILHIFKRYKIPIILTLHDYKMVCASYSMLSNGTVCEACKNGKYYHCFLKGCVKDSRMKSLLNTLEMYLHHKILHIYDLVDIFISPSKFLKDKFNEMVVKWKIVNLPYFVRVEEFEPEYNWQENSIVYFGRLSKEKGLYILIEAIKDIKDVCLKIIGEGPIEESLKLKVKIEKLNNIDFLGYKNREDLKNEIRKSMFVVVPSEWYENFPFSTIEAFALGKPVIGSKIGGIPELIEDNVTGLTSESGNVEDLREKISYMLNNQDKVIEMGKNARVFVKKELNAEKHYEKLMQIYQELI